MKYKILDEDNIVTEEHLRRKLFDYATDDLLDYKEDYLKGIYQVDYLLNCINKAIDGDITEVINMLETSWNFSIEKIKE